MVRKTSGYGLFCALSKGLKQRGFGLRAGAVGGLAAALSGAGCEAARTPFLSAPSGPDTTAPVLRLTPGHDTTADATGTLLLTVNAHDTHWVTRLDLVVLDGTFGFSPIMPDTTDVTVSYPIALAGLGNTSFRWFVRATDILNHQSVSDTVTVSVR